MLKSKFIKLTSNQKQIPKKRGNIETAGTKTTKY